MEREIVLIASYFGRYDGVIKRCIKEVSDQIGIPEKNVARDVYEITQSNLVAFIDDVNLRLPTGMENIKPLGIDAIWQITKIAPSTIVDSPQGINMVTTLWNKIHTDKYSLEEATDWIEELLPGEDVEVTMNRIGDRLMDKIYPRKYSRPISTFRSRGEEEELS